MTSTTPDTACGGTGQSAVCDDDVLVDCHDGYALSGTACASGGCNAFEPL